MAIIYRHIIIQRLSVWIFIYYTNNILWFSILTVDLYCHLFSFNAAFSSCQDTRLFWYIIQYFQLNMVLSKVYRRFNPDGLCSDSVTALCILFFKLYCISISIFILFYFCLFIDYSIPPYAHWHPMHYALLLYIITFD